MALDTIGSIATHIAESFILPAGVSGNLVETVDLCRIDVENFTGNSIGSNSIESKYQSAITNLSKANSLDQAFLWAATRSSSGTANSVDSTSNVNVSLGELSVSESSSSKETEAMNAISSMSRQAPQQFREMAIQSMKIIGRNIQFARSLS
jgi:hypothetical protein